MIRPAQEAEGVAAAWLRRLAFDDAKATSAAADGGVDGRTGQRLVQVVERIEGLWGHLLTLRQPAARDRYRSRLSFYGVPQPALTLRVRIDEVLAMPFFAPLMENPGGQRFAVADGNRG